MNWTPIKDPNFKFYVKVGFSTSWEIFFVKNQVENEAGRLVPDLSLFSKKALHEVKAGGEHLTLIHVKYIKNIAYMQVPQLGNTTKGNCKKF